QDSFERLPLLCVLVPQIPHGDTQPKSGLAPSSPSALQQAHHETSLEVLVDLCHLASECRFRETSRVHLPCQITPVSSCKFEAVGMLDSHHFQPAAPHSPPLSPTFNSSTRKQSPQWPQNTR